MRFKVVIPLNNLDAANRGDLARLSRLIESGWCQGLYREEPVLPSGMVLAGEAPTSIVTVLAALAQGHPIDGLLEAAEAS